MPVTLPSKSDAPAERERFFGAAKLIAALTLLSRVGGLLRDMVLSRSFGASAVTDAFWLAFMVPNLFRRLFGEGALSAALVPVFSEIHERQGPEQASSLLANVLGWAGLGLTGLCVLIQAGLLLTAWLAPGDATRQLLLGYTVLMMPFMVTVCLLALGSAALQCVGHFAYPAAAPILLNLCIIGGTVLVASHWDQDADQLRVVALSVLAAGVGQLVGLGWLLRRHNLSIRPRLWPIHPGLRRMVTLFLPMLLPLGVLQLNALLDKLIARLLTALPADPTLSLGGLELSKPLAVGTVTWLSYGERLYQFPLGVLAIALATAVFPLFSRYAARGDTEGLRDSINRALRLAVFEGLPSGVGLLLLAGPLSLAIFGGGEFSASDAAATAHVVRFYGLGMWAFCAQQILLRAFYAQKDTTTPLKIACVLVVLNFGLNLLLVWVPFVRHGAFGLSSSITAAVNVILLSWILRRRLGRLGLRSLLTGVGRTVLASIAMGAAMVGVLTLLPHLGLGRPVPMVAGGFCVGVAVFAATAWLLRSPELAELLGPLARRKAS